MRCEITERGDEVEMRVGGIGNRGPELLAAMQECQEGRCSCPTDQYNRLNSIDVQAGDDEITVSLRPRVGQRLDVKQLQACLDYTVAQAQAE